MQRTFPQRNRGSASIELCVGFVLMFLVFYAIVGYTIPLLLGASYHEIATDSLYEAVRLQHELGSDTSPEENARRAIERSWLPEKWAEPCAEYGGNFLSAAGDVWRVCVRNASPEAIIPPINLFGWEVPKLPAEIRGEAILQIR